MTAINKRVLIDGPVANNSLMVKYLGGDCRSQQTDLRPSVVVVCLNQSAAQA
jgi:hypothetical protein